MHALPDTTLIGVVGAGAMGAGIAQVAAAAGHPVRLFDTRPQAAAQAIEQIAQQLQARVASGKLSAAAREHLLANLEPAQTLSDLAQAGLVIEAIVEDLAVKRQLFEQLESLCADNCILASNTSSISISTLAATLRQPARLLGMHFFNPAPVMPLVEVISGLDSDPHLADVLYDTARQWGKQPVKARSTPGFIVNRVARPFYAESLRLLQEGASDCATLDALLREAGGFAMGPFELTDLIGHDVNYAVTCSVFDSYYGDPRFQPSLRQKELVDAGRFGRKRGQGFYPYGEDSNRPQPSTLPAGPAPTQVLVEGNLGPAEALLQRLEQAGIGFSRRDGNGLLRIDGACLALTDGRMACERAQQDGLEHLALFDLALDYHTTTRLALSFSPGMPDAQRQAISGLLQQAGIQPSELSDSPGLVVMRTVAMLANEAADALLQGVASARDIDLAMRAGVNYPRGPLAWADQLGPRRVWHVLEHLQRSYGEPRYRPSLLLRRLNFSGGTLHD